MKRIVPIAMFLAILSPSFARASVITPIFPGPDVPQLVGGTSYAIGWWTSSDIADVKIDLYYQDSFEKTLVNSTPNDGKWIWQVPLDQHSNSDYTLRISDASNPDVYNDSLEFAAGGSGKSLQMTYPFNENQNEIAIAGSPFNATWTPAHPGELIDVQLWYINDYQTIATRVADTGSFTWNVPAGQHQNSDYRIIIQDSDNIRCKGATTEFSVAPEPASLLLLALGGLALMRRSLR